jgi:replicative DNA helicase
MKKPKSPNLQRASGKVGQVTMTDLVPYSEEMEQAVIGAVLTRPLAYLNVASFLQADDFFFLRHAYIWQAIGRLEQRKDEIDTVTVSRELEAVEHLEEIGGPAYLTELIRDTETSMHAEVYGRMVKRLSLRRHLLQVKDEIGMLAVDETQSIEKIFAEVEKRIFNITSYGMERKETAISSIVQSFADDMEEKIQMRSEGHVPGLPTGIPDVDHIIGGSYRGEVQVIGAPPKMGKSTYGLNIARNRARAGARVVIFITEMSANDIMRKFVSMETGIPAQAIKDAILNRKQYAKYIAAMSKINKWPMHIIDSYRNLSPLDVRRELRRIAHHEKVDSVLIDGLWMMASDNPVEKRNKELAIIMIALVDIAKEFNVPIDLVHQFGRGAENRNKKRPRLSDFADSADVERNAFVLIGLYRDNYYFDDGSDETEVIIMATRSGQIGTAELKFNQQSETYGNPIVELPPDPLQLPMTVEVKRKDIYH